MDLERVTNMSHEVDTMMYTGALPWHKLGTYVPEAPTAADALRHAGLEWTVRSEQIFAEDQEVVDGYRLNRRSDTRAILGLVSDRYKVVQNAEAFEWVDDLMGQGMRFETAGALRNGQRIWLTAKLPEDYKVAGDPVTTYLTFTNGHDGRHGVQVMVSPVRVVCQNTLNYAVGVAPRTWSAVHALNIHSRMAEARQTLDLTEGYMQALNAQAQQWANIALDPGSWHDIVQELLPTKAERISPRLDATRMTLESAMWRPDQQEFIWTGWGAANAVAWLASHQQHPQNPERAMTSFLDGDRMLRRLDDLLNPDTVTE